jgi:uncharacterized membrane protein (UPF0127 family)
MKVGIKVVISVLALGALALFFFMQEKNFVTTPTKVTIGTTVVSVELADTPALRVQGLSGRQSPSEGEGMLFIFEEEGNWGFWMKDMLFPIDILWAGSDGTIISIAKDVSPSTYPQAFYPTEPAAKYVLEVPAGFAKRHNIVEGMKMER